MRRRDIEKALRRAGCIKVANSGRGGHDKWICPGGEHTVNLPRHTDISPGVVRDILSRMTCLGKDWLS